jgi:hypothetical protein
MKYILATVSAMAILFCGSAVHAKKAKPEGVQGRISSISQPAADGSETVVVMVGGKDKHEVTLTVNKDTKVLIDGKDGALSDLKARERVRVVGEKPVTEIEILGKKTKSN